MKLNYFTFKNQDINCNQCGWSGIGSNLQYGDYHEDFIVDMCCPKCNETIGFWQSPLNNEVDEWKKANPNSKTGWDEIDKL